MMDPFEITPDISVVIPVYNEGSNIRPLANEVFDALAGRIHYELIFVDDGSVELVVRIDGVVNATDDFLVRSG